jgi:hypothetical protein
MNKKMKLTPEQEKKLKEADLEYQARIQSFEYDFEKFFVGKGFVTQDDYNKIIKDKK